jgi:phosphoribosylglycinamide formyltransferase-1
MAKRIGVLLSGRGSNFEALAESVAAGRLPGAEIAIVISNREGAPGIDRARARGIEARVIPSKGLQREEYDRQVAAALKEKQVDLVCLAGFMRLLSPYFVNEFRGRILNIHPSLLPAFPGLEAQRQSLEYGVKFSGCTVHFVDENLDAGPIVAQAVVPVLDGDTPETLAEKILKEEHRIYTEAVRIVLEGQYRVEGRRVIGGLVSSGLVMDARSTEILLNEYERAQEVAQHSDAVFWEITSIIWGANTLLLGFVLEAIKPGTANSLITATAMIGTVLSLLVLGTYYSSKVGQKIAFDICRRIESQLSTFHRLHTEITRKYPKYFLLKLIWFVTLVFLGLWLFVGYSANGTCGTVLVASIAIVFGVLLILFRRVGVRGSAKLE